MVTCFRYLYTYIHTILNHNANEYASWKEMKLRERLMPGGFVALSCHHTVSPRASTCRFHDLSLTKETTYIPTQRMYTEAESGGNNPSPLLFTVRWYCPFGLCTRSVSSSPVSMAMLIRTSVVALYIGGRNQSVRLPRPHSNAFDDGLLDG